MSRVFQISSVARLVGLPTLTVQRRLMKAGVKPAHSLVIVSGPNEIVSPLYAEEQLREVAEIARGQSTPTALPAAPQS